MKIRNFKIKNFDSPQKSKIFDDFQALKNLWFLVPQNSKRIFKTFKFPFIGEEI